MPPSIDVLTNSWAPAWPTALMALKSPLPSPNVMVPNQSLETKRAVFPSVMYFIAFSYLVNSKFLAEGSSLGRQADSNADALRQGFQFPGRDIHHNPRRWVDA